MELEEAKIRIKEPSEVFENPQIESKDPNTQFLEVSEDQGGQKIGWVKYCIILYFTVCGGAWGSERILNAFPATALLLLLILPFIWNFMMSLISAELGLSMKENGIFQWVETAFGKGLAFVTTVSYWLFYLVRSCTFYVLILDYLAISNTEYFKSNFWKIIPVLTVAIVMAINLYGVDFLASISTILLIPALGPFIMVFIMNIIKGDMHPSDWVRFAPKGFYHTLADWKLFGTAFQIAVWDNSAYDCVGNTVGTLKEPEKNLVKSLIAAVIAATITYLFCVIAFVGITDDYDSILTGYWVLMAEAVGGYPAFYITIVCGMIANVAICNTLMLPISLQLCSIADYLKIPRLAYKNSKGTPIFSIIVNSLICMLLVLLPFEFLVSVSNILYSVCIIVMCVAAIRLRYKFPHMKRPFMISKHNFVVILVCLFPLLICVVMIGTSIAQSVLPLIGAVIFYIALTIAYVVIEKVRKTRLKEVKNENVELEEMRIQK